MAAPLQYRWENGIMQPVGRCAEAARQQFNEGEIYTLQRGRSDASHKHEFAWLHEAWLQLPERFAPDFPTSEHLRKAALIDAGFYREQIIDAGTNAAALRVANGIKAREQYSKIVVRGPIVVIRDPESQSKHAMGGDRFQKSKTAILEIISAMIGVSPESLRENAGKAA